MGTFASQYGLFVIAALIAVGVLVGVLTTRRRNTPGDFSGTDANGVGTQTRTNGLAVAALIVVFFFALVGVILGYVSLAQIDRTGEQGRGLAAAAVILGWIFLAIGVAVAFVAVSLMRP